ncbi:uncharacterized protein LOC118761523 [Octopus sinensis]|uniref:Uncharacterized protein LOC118761523 n=1 Tax=Octopus sinensis TaxID=2607531 RepID=A0A7E6EJB3_9MOLL|nr:uncharacterized protein LOC118761523 [Octopus sinensis]
MIDEGERMELGQSSTYPSFTNVVSGYQFYCGDGLLEYKNHQSSWSFVIFEFFSNFATDSVMRARTSAYCNSEVKLVLDFPCKMGPRFCSNIALKNDRQHLMDSFSTACNALSLTTSLQKTVIIYQSAQDDNGNLYPSFETPNAIKDKKFTLKCNVEGGRRVWYTGNGTVIAKYLGANSQNRPKYFGSRQETSCQEKICTLSITNVSLAEDNMSIICSTGLHTSMFNITVFGK